MDKITSTNADRLKRLMESKEWNPQLAAVAFGVDRASIYNWLAGKPMSGMAERILSLLEGETDENQ